MEWTKKTWQTVLLITIINLLLSGVVAFTVNAFSAREETLQGAASTEYVNKLDADQKCYIDQQDQVLQEGHEELHGEIRLKADQSEVDKLYNKTEENNRLLFEILKIVKKLD